MSFTSWNLDVWNTHTPTHPHTLLIMLCSRKRWQYSLSSFSPPSLLFSIPPSSMFFCSIASLLWKRFQREFLHTDTYWWLFICVDRDLVRHIYIWEYKHWRFLCTEITFLLGLFYSRCVWFIQQLCTEPCAGSLLWQAAVHCGQTSGDSDSTF